MVATVVEVELDAVDLVRPDDGDQAPAAKMALDEREVELVARLHHAGEVPEHVGHVGAWPRAPPLVVPRLTDRSGATRDANPPVLDEVGQRQPDPARHAPLMRHVRVLTVVEVKIGEALELHVSAAGRKAARARYSLFVSHCSFLCGATGGSGCGGRAHRHFRGYLRFAAPAAIQRSSSSASHMSFLWLIRVAGRPWDAM
jgi:hypothetical protein